jgi:transcriptional regulator with XRE-family HTH domain
LRQLRKQHGLTQKSLAEKLGVSTPALCRWETGQTLPRKANIQAFADAFNMSEAEFLAAVGANDDSAPAVSLTEERAARSVGADLTIVETSLRNVLLACKRRIAEAAGTTPERIKIVIEV